MSAPVTAQTAPAKLFYSGSVEVAQAAPVLSLRDCQCDKCTLCLLRGRTPTGRLQAVVELQGGDRATLIHARPTSFHEYPF